MQEEQNGISIADIFRTIFVQKWLTLAIAVVLTVACTFGIYFLGNGNKRYYEMCFSLVMPNNTNEAIYTYPDGTKMHYADFISYTSLNRAAEMSGINVDVNRIINNGDISISRTVSEYEGVNYTVTCKSEYFASYDSARQFLAAVAHLPVSKFSSMVLNYDVYLTLASQADDYESEIGLLISQLESVEHELSSLITIYGGQVIAGGKSLNAHYNEVKAYSDKGTLNILLTRVKNEAIIKNEKSRDNYRVQQVRLQREYDMAKATLDNILLAAKQNGEASPIIVDSAVIKEQSDLVEKLSYELQDVKKYLDEGRIDGAFENDYIKPEYDTLKSFTDGLNQTVVEVYDKAASVSFTKANVISTEGGTGLLTSILISLVLGIVVALIAGYVAGRITLNKRAKAQPAETAAEPAAEPPLKTDADGTPDGE